MQVLILPNQLEMIMPFHLNGVNLKTEKEQR